MVWERSCPHPHVGVSEHGPPTPAPALPSFLPIPLLLSPDPSPKELAPANGRGVPS